MDKTLRIAERQRGQVVIMGAFALFAVLVVSGLAIDVGRYVVVRAELSKAVDGAALAGAKALPDGRSHATAAAMEYAEMNFSNGFMNTTSHGFTVNWTEVPSVRVLGTAQMPTTFLRLVGINISTVQALAEAARPPISVALVLDNSGSLDEDFAGVDAIGYLRTAAEEFVDFFIDDRDQMALVLFSTGTEVRFPLGYGFTSPITTAIRAMNAVSYTNLSDGVRGGYAQLQGDTDPQAVQALVFFTDGKATALRDVFLVNGNPIDGVITGDQDPSGDVFDTLYRPNRLHQSIPGAQYTSNQFPNGMPRNVPNLQNLANQNLLTAASQVRSDDIPIFVIALGNPLHHETWKQPDLHLLVEVANVEEAPKPGGGVIYNPNYDPNQPEGAFYFAPDATQLSLVFDQVGRDIAVRLTQ